jgi:hypothetical protein
VFDTHVLEEAMAQYLILIYADETQFAKADDQVWVDMMQAHNRFAEQVVAEGGQILGGNALMPSTTATTIRDDVVTDGPFVESKELLGGYYLVEAKDLDHAITFGKLCPALHGGVEVRPVMDTAMPEHGQAL